MKQAKRTLVLSAIVLLLSVAMLAGATFAWFTDSVTNSGNKIEAGKLEVDLLQKNSTLSAAQQAEITEASDKPLTTEDGFTVISALTSPVFNYSLWEPGYSTGAVFKVKNSGTLAFKFAFAFGNCVVTKNLGNVLIVSVNGEDKGTLAEFATGTPFFSGILGSGMTSAELDIVIRMDTSAGNDYQGATAKFDLVLKAVQTSLEEDGFGNADYDAAAPEGWVDAPKADSVVVPVTPGEDTTIVNPDYPAKAEIPAAALADDATSLTFTVKETESVPAGITVSAGQEALPFDIKMDGLKADNTAPVAVSLFVGKDLTDVTVYHNSDAIESTYDSATGIVSFTTTSFSPFTITFFTPATVDLWQHFADGKGTQEDPFLISTTDHFNNINDYLADDMKAGMPYYFRQTADLELTESGIALCGKYDGGDFSVTAANQAQKTTTLFGETYGTFATICNLTMISRETSPMIGVWTNGADHLTYSKIVTKALDNITVSVNNNNFGFLLVNAMYEGFGSGNAQTYLFESITNYASVSNAGTCTSPFVGSGPCLNDTASSVTYKQCINHGDLTGTSYVGFYYGNPTYIESVRADGMFDASGCANHGILTATEVTGKAEIALGDWSFVDVFEDGTKTTNTGAFLSGNPIANVAFDIYSVNDQITVVSSDAPQSYTYYLVASINTIYWDDGYVSSGAKIYLPVSLAQEAVDANELTANMLTPYDRQTAIQKGIITETDSFIEQVPAGGYQYILKVVDGKMYLILNIGENGSINSDASHPSAISFRIAAFDANGQLIGFKSL